MFLTSLFGLMLLTSVTNFLMFVVALETASLGMYVLAASMRNEKTSLEAGIKFFINSAFATAIMLWGISILFGVTGSLDFSSVASGLFQYIGDEIKPFPMLGILALLVGLGFKITLFPFHLWAPDVYEGSPTPFTAFLATISKAAGIAVLIRIFAVPINDLVPDFNGLLWILSAFTMLAASSTALWQSSAKRLLAYSSISHAGFILMGIAAFGTVEDALLASVSHIPPTF
ncbi:MAG: proton-conducting transporter membrane subunit [Planctomycetota bacterium]|nr:proton-conducting transporter membrane subunit [Planctomycetota bacterium]